MPNFMMMGKYEKLGVESIDICSPDQANKVSDMYTLVDSYQLFYSEERSPFYRDNECIQIWILAIVNILQNDIINIYIYWIQTI